MDCKFLKSPMAGEISPPRFKFDRFLEQCHRSLRTKLIQFISDKQKKKISVTHQSNRVKKTKEWAYRVSTERLTLSQKTPRQEQISSLCTSSQSSKTLTTLLNEALIDISAFPTYIPTIFILNKVSLYSNIVELLGLQRFQVHPI